MPLLDDVLEDADELKTLRKRWIGKQKAWIDAHDGKEYKGTVVGVERAERDYVLVIKTTLGKIMKVNL